MSDGSARIPGLNSKIENRASKFPRRFVAVATVAVFLLLVARFWHPVYGFTSFLQLDSSNDTVKIAAFKERPVFVYRDTGGYDGLYYAQIAYHPLLTDPELAPAMDNLAYRAKRILPPALAWLIAFGNPAWIVHVYSLLNVAAWLVLAALLWRLLAVDSWRGWVAWSGVLFSAGALSSVRFALTDLVALAILAGALLAIERGRRGWAVGTLAAAGLARETSLLALAGLVERPWWSRRNLLLLVAAILPLSAWLLYVGWVVRGSSSGLANFDWPVLGYIGKWKFLAYGLQHEPERLLVWTSLLAMVGFTVQAAFLLIHRQPSDRWYRVGLAYTLLLLCLGAPVWEGYPGAVTRVLLPLTLAFNILAARSRVSSAWLVAGNLAVLSGLLAVWNVPHDPRELAATHQGGTACVARLESGWYNVERATRHTRSWSSGDGQVDLVTWGRRTQVVRLDFLIRSPQPRTVTIRDGSAVLWHGTVGPKELPVSIGTILKDGHGHLELSTPEPAVPEAPERGGRSLAFALYDARLSLPEP